MAKVKNAFTESASPANLAAGVADQLINSAVGSLSPLNNFGRYVTGSRAIIKVNSKLFGFAFGVTWHISTDYQENQTIDDWTAYELMPTRVTIDGTLSMFHIPGKGPSKELVQANILSFLFHRYITLEISDQTSGQILFKTNRAMITSRSQSVTAGELSTIQLTWKALAWQDELSPFFPQGFDGSNAGPLSLGGIGKVLG